jgi:hypothetical protein
VQLSNGAHANTMFDGVNLKIPRLKYPMPFSLRAIAGTYAFTNVS